MAGLGWTMVVGAANGNVLRSNWQGKYRAEGKILTKYVRNNPDAHADAHGFWAVDLAYPALPACSMF